MAARAGTAFVEFEGRFNRLERQVSQMSGQLSRQLGSQMSRSMQASHQSALRAMASRQRQTLRELQRLTKRTAVGLAGAATAGAAAGIKLNAQWESVNASFSTFLGSTKEAEKFVERLRKVSSKSPLRLTEYAEAARMLMGFGVEARKVVPMLEAVNMAVVATGKGEEDMMRVVRALGQIEAKGKVSAEELMQLAEAGVPVNKILQKELGLTGEQVGNIGKEGVKSEKALAAIARGWRRQYDKAFKDASETFNVQISNLRKDFEQALRLGSEPLFEMLRDRVLPRLRTELGRFIRVMTDESLSGRERMQRLRSELQRVGRELEALELPRRFGELMDEWTPKIAEFLGRALAKIAPRAAKTFLDAFLNAGPWGRLLIGGWLLKKLGGWAAFRALGQRGGAEMSAGIVAGATPGLVAGSAGMGAAMGAATAASAASAMQVSWTRGPGGAMIAQIGQQTGASIGAAVPSGLQRARGRIVGAFRALGPAIAAALAIAVGPEIARNMAEGFSKRTQTLGLPKQGGLPGVSRGGPLGGGLLHRIVGESEVEEFGRKADEQFRKLLSARNIDGLRALAAGLRAVTDEPDFRKFSREFRNAARTVEQEAERIRREADQMHRKVGDAFDEMSQAGGLSMKAIRDAVESSSRTIAYRLDRDSAVGRQALARNFGLAIDAVKRSMREGTVAVEDGMAFIRRMVDRRLRQFGVDPNRADSFMRQVAQGSTGRTRVEGRQRGGMIMVGAPSGDSVPAMLERGEYVLNREAVRAVGRENLDRINFRAAPRFQRGGMAGPMGAGAGHAPIANFVSRRWGIRVTSGLRPGAITTTGNPSDHGWGGAADYNAFGPTPTPASDAAAAWMRRTLGPAIKQLLYRTWVGGNHFNHIHLALKREFAFNPARVAALIGGAGSLIPRVRMRGDLGQLSALGQRALDTTREAANRFLDRALGSMDSGAIGDPSTGHGALSKAQLRSLWVRAGGDPRMANLMAAIALAESGGNPAAVNPSSGATGLWQIHPPEPGSRDPLRNAQIAVRKLATQGLGAWEAYTRGMHTQFLQRGGVVGLQAGGGVGGTRAPALKKAKRKSSKGDKKKARKWAPPRYRHRLREVLAGQFFELFGSRVAQLNQFFENIERAQSLTDEESTKRIPVSAATDAELAAHGLNPEQIARLRSEPDRIVELLNPEDIQRRVGEIDQLIGIKGQIAEQLRQQQVAASEALRQYAQGIAERIARAEAIRERVRALLDRIRALVARAREMDRQERRVRDPRQRRLLERQHRPERRRIARELDRLRDQTQRLVGARGLEDIRSALRAEDGGGGLLRSTMSSLRSWQDARDSLAPDAEQVPQRMFETGLDAQFLLKERRDWLNTPPPGVDVPAPPEPDAPDTEADRRRAELLEEQLRIERQRLRVSEAHFQVFRDLPSFGGGGVVPGPAGASRIIEAHGREVVFTPDQMQALGGTLAQPRVVVLVQDGAVDARRIRVLAGEEAERVVRGNAQRADRRLPSRGGGVLTRG